MNIHAEFKKMAAEKASTFTYLAKCISLKKNKHYTVQNLSNKLKNGTVNFNELQIMLDELGYVIKFEPKNN